MAFEKDFNFLDACKKVNKAWTQISTSTLANAWRRILSPNENLKVTPTIDIGDKSEISKMLQLIQFEKRGENVDSEDIHE